MLFHEIVYSVAGGKSEPTYLDFTTIRQPLLTLDEQALLEEMVSVYKAKQLFPTYKFLVEKFGDYERKCNSPADVHSALTTFLKGRETELIRREVLERLSKGITDPIELKTSISEVIERKDVSTSIKISTVESVENAYKAREILGGGFKLGVRQIDEITGGFQQGLVATIAAWTSHGKSLAGYNACYKAASEGKKCGLVGLEIPKIFIKMILLSRHSYELGKKIIPYENIIKNILTDADKKYLFEEVEPSYEKLPGKITILNSEDIQSYTKEGIINLYRTLDELMDGLDMVAWDHVNLFQYIKTDRFKTGDDYIKLLTEVGSIFVTKKGTLISTIFFAQVNREGWRRAQRKEGQYTMLALSEFHEIERSSTYVIFLYADSYMIQMNELKIELVKHRIGSVMDSPETIYLHAPCSVLGDSQSASQVTDTKMDELLGDLMSSDGSGLFDGL